MALLFARDRQTARDGPALANLLTQEHLTVMQATPATWQLLVQTGWTSPTSLTILCGGEALPRTLGQTLLSLSRQFWNVYGPTETTIWSTAHSVTQSPQSPTFIGKPLANTQVYILDSSRQCQSPGIPGELCIAGAGVVARGYWNRPDLTADKFIDVGLFGQSTRVYRTGDLARWLPDGNLEYLGRLDHQVKLRGFRIEVR